MKVTMKTTSLNSNLYFIFLILNMERCIRCNERLATKVVTYELYNLPKAYWVAVDMKVCDICSDRLEQKEKAGLIRNYRVLQNL